MKTNTTELRTRIDKSGLKYKFIAEKIGITPQGLLKKIENTNEFKASEIEKLCELLLIGDIERIGVFFAKDVELQSTHNATDPAQPTPGPGVGQPGTISMAQTHQTADPYP